MASPSRTGSGGIFSGLAPRITVVFDRPDAVYFPGDLVRGTVLVHLTRSTSIRCIRIRLSGRATCRWTGAHDFVRQSSYKCFSERRILFGHGVSSSSTELETLHAGDHQFSFIVPLPGGSNLPPSFEANDYFTGRGITGHIRYSAKIVIDRGKWQPSVRHWQPFNIKSILDANSPAFAAPTPVVQLQTNMGYLADGIVTVGASIVRSGFAAGETIPVRVTRVASSAVYIKEARVRLYRVFRLAANGLLYTVRGSVSEIVNPPALIGRLKAGLPLDAEIMLPVPKRCRPSMSNCPLVHVDYEVVVKLSRGPWKSMSVTVPVTICSIPHLSSGLFAESDAPWAASVRDRDVELPSYHEAVISVQEDFMPPSYEYTQLESENLVSVQNSRFLGL